MKECSFLLVDNHSSLCVIISNPIFINIHTHRHTPIQTHISDLALYLARSSLVCSSKRQQSLYSAFSFVVGRMGLVFSHCIVKKEERQDRKTASPAVEHALTHTVILFSSSSPPPCSSSRHSTSTSTMLHNASTISTTISSSIFTSSSRREVGAYRVENFIERDDELALRVLALPILFLHITSELVLPAR